MTRALSARMAKLEHQASFARWHVVVQCPDETIEQAWLHHPSPYRGLPFELIVIESEFQRQGVDDCNLAAT